MKWFKKDKPNEIPNAPMPMHAFDQYNSWDVGTEIVFSETTIEAARALGIDPAELMEQTGDKVAMTDYPDSERDWLRIQESAQDIKLRRHQKN